MKRLVAMSAAVAAMGAVLVLWGGAAAGEVGTLKGEDGPDPSGIFDFKDVDFGTGLTECPQAGIRLDPKPLDRRQVDQVEQLSNEGSNVRPNQEFSCFPQNETSIAINPLSPTNLVGGANDYRLGWGTSGFYASTDNGQHWYNGIRPFPGPLPNGDDHLNGGGDPAVVFDREGVAYYVDIHFERTNDTNGIFASRSSNGGFTWSKPCIALGSSDATARCGGVGDPRQPGDGTVTFTEDNDLLPNDSIPFDDKEYVATGPRPAGVQPQCFAPVSRTAVACDPNRLGIDRIYVTWTRFAPTTSNILLSFSDDRARSWSPPVLVSRSAAFCTGGASGVNACDSNQGSQPVVNPTTGALYVSYENFNTPAENQYLVSKSVDGGQTFEKPLFITPVFDVNYPRSGVGTTRRNDCAARGQQSGRRVLTNSCFRVNARGAIAVDQRGGAFADDLYVVIADNRNGTRASTNTDVSLFKSTNGGLTWRGPTRVNDDRSVQPTTGTPPVSNRNCSFTVASCQGNFGNDQWYPWIDISRQGDLNVVFFDRRLDTDSTAGEWPTSRVPPNGRAGNYLVWTFGAQCTVTQADSSECTAPTAGLISQPTAPVSPGNVLFPDQTVFPFRNFQVSDVPSNMDYSFRAGVFNGDYQNVAVRGAKAVAFFTDARNGRSSRNQPGRNPACEQSDVFAGIFDARQADSAQTNTAQNQLFLVTPCPAQAVDLENADD